MDYPPRTECPVLGYAVGGHALIAAIESVVTRLDLVTNASSLLNIG